MEVRLAAAANDRRCGLLRAVFIAEHQKDRVTVFFSGVQRYYRTFGVSQSATVFELVREQYRYFAISFTSVKTVFTNWYLNDRKGFRVSKFCSRIQMPTTFSSSRRAMRQIYSPIHLPRSSRSVCG